MNISVRIQLIIIYLSQVENLPSDDDTNITDDKANDDSAPTLCRVSLTLRLCFEKPENVGIYIWMKENFSLPPEGDCYEDAFAVKLGYQRFCLRTQRFCDWHCCHRRSATPILTSKPSAKRDITCWG